MKHAHMQGLLKKKSNDFEYSIEHANLMALKAEAAIVPVLHIIKGNIIGQYRLLWEHV